LSPCFVPYATVQKKPAPRLRASEPVLTFGKERMAKPLWLVDHISCSAPSAEKTQPPVLILPAVALCRDQGAALTKSHLMVPGRFSDLSKFPIARPRHPVLAPLSPPAVDVSTHR